MKRLLFFLLGLSQAFAGELVGVTPDEMDALVKKGSTVVDIRTPQEWKATGLIPGSHGLTYFDASGHYDKEDWLGRLKPLLGSAGQPVILVCRSGNRSATVGKMLVNEAGFDRVYHLEKGIRGWTAESRSLAAQ